MPNPHRPRVVHVVPALFGPDGVIGGAERYALELARSMADRTPTSLVTFGPSALRRREGPLEVEVLRNWIHVRRFRLDPVNPLLVARLRRADIIHYHQTHTLMASLALLFARATGTPIFTSHLGGSGYGLHRVMDVNPLYRGHLHISEFSKRALGHAALPNASVILGGVDTRLFCPDPAVRRTREVLYVGRLLPHKGINYLVEAVDQDVPLRLVGRRWRHAQRFYELLVELGRGKQVSFHEDFDDAAIVDAYRRALCVVLPSVHTTVFGEHYAIPELLGQTLLEGMACGTPAICTAAGSMPEVVEDGVTGFVVPPNDARALRDRIRWLREHPDEAERMGQAARRRVLERFTWSSVVDRCFRAYGLESERAPGERAA